MSIPTWPQSYTSGPDRCMSFSCCSACLLWVCKARRVQVQCDRILAIRRATYLLFVALDSFAMLSLDDRLGYQLRSDFPRTHVHEEDVRLRVRQLVVVRPGACARSELRRHGLVHRQNHKAHTQDSRSWHRTRRTVSVGRRTHASGARVGSAGQATRDSLLLGDQARTLGWTRYGRRPHSWPGVLDHPCPASSPKGAATTTDSTGR